MRAAVVVFVMLVISTARAETVAERAKRLFDEGWALKDKGDPRACDRFEESYRLVAAAGTGVNLAECMEQQGKLLRAWQLYTNAVIEWQRDAKDKRAAFARDRVREIEPKLVTLVIEIDDPALDKLRVSIGERVVEPKQKIQQLADPGEIEIRAFAPGHVPFVESFEAEAGTTRKVHIALAPLASDGTPLVDTHRRRSRVVLGIGLGAVGIGAIVAGTVLFVDARSLQSEGETDRAQQKADLATALGIGGALCVVAGTVVFLTAPRDTTVAPIVTPTTAGLSLGGTF